MMIRNPVEWIADELMHVGHAMRSITHPVHASGDAIGVGPPMIRRIGVSDLKDVVAKGFSDLGANRADIVFLCFFYPVIGLILARVASGGEMLPLLFPLASGFALVGPLAGVGLYEISRLRERGVEARWRAAFGVVHSPSFGGIVLLGLVLTGVFIVWLLTAHVIYLATFGAQAPESIVGFVRAVLTTPAGWMMTILGVGAGFIFALLVLTISVVSFPMLLDRDVGVELAVRTSIRAVVANPGPMALWGLIVASGLVIGSIPLFLGLVIVLPVLGHSTWHLYRKIVVN